MQLDTIAAKPADSKRPGSWHAYFRISEADMWDEVVASSGEQIVYTTEAYALQAALFERDKALGVRSLSTGTVSFGKPDRDNGRENAEAWLEEIKASVIALRNPDEGSERWEEEQDKIAGRALCIMVRDGWRNSGEPCGDEPAEDYAITLSFGGPSLEIRGELDSDGYPKTAALVFHHWGEPETLRVVDEEGRDALLAYAGVFAPMV